MDELERYGHVIRALILEYAALKPSIGDVAVEVIIDESRGHYELMHSGWAGAYRIHGSVIHVDILDGKVWIQHDGTSDALADRMVEAGIPKDKIVLAFKPPDIRPYTGFAAA